MGLVNRLVRFNDEDIVDVDGRVEAAVEGRVMEEEEEEEEGEEEKEDGESDEDGLGVEGVAERIRLLVE